MADLNKVGEWLRKKRLEKGWTQAELADRSGVSGQTISNIEVGRSPNPQAAIRARLEKALETEAPAEAVAAEQKEQQIVGLGTLQDFDPYGDDLPACHGVYVFYDITDRPYTSAKQRSVRSV